MRGGDIFVIDDQTSVKVTELNHPGGYLGFRIQDHEAVLAYCTDTGQGVEEKNYSLEQLANGADLLILDFFFAIVEKANTFAD